jgi:hypothetical protein
MEPKEDSPITKLNLPQKIEEVMLGLIQLSPDAPKGGMSTSSRSATVRELVLFLNQPKLDIVEFTSKTLSKSFFRKKLEEAGVSCKDIAFFKSE